MAAETAAATALNFMMDVVCGVVGDANQEEMEVRGRKPNGRREEKTGSRASTDGSCQLKGLPIGQAQHTRKGQFQGEEKPERGGRRARSSCWETGGI